MPEPREFAAGSENPEEALLDTELRRVMHAALKSLSETLRSVFVLRCERSFNGAYGRGVGTFGRSSQVEVIAHTAGLARAAGGLYEWACSTRGNEMMDQQAGQHLLGQLSDYVDGGLEQSTCEEIGRHLADCQNCRVVVAFSVEPARIQLAWIQDLQRDLPPMLRC